MTNGADVRSAVTALNRFGLGARPGDLARAAADPRGFLLAELKQPDAAVLRADLPTTPGAFAAFFDEQERLKERRTAAAEARRDPAASGEGTAPMMAAAAAPGPAGPNQRADEMRVRFATQLAAPAGLVERLVTFWSNHFAISTRKGLLSQFLAGPYEREAIRPHVLGRFGDMLRAVEQHPAMIVYLDNTQSIGPGSRAGTKNKRGLNENLAREILELHTLGVDGGYRQEDVTSLARIITGWSFAGRDGKGGAPGTFVFRPQWHEPGDHRVLGKVYPAGGVEQGEAALADIARHPATARHIATKLVRHFVADKPPAPLVSRLATAFRDSDGDLMATTVALLNADEAWTAPPTKMRTPFEFVIAMARATGFAPKEPGYFLRQLKNLGMPLWQPGGPNGYTDSSEEWSAPAAMRYRLDAAWAFAQHDPDRHDPVALLDAVLGPVVSKPTRDAVMHAATRTQALAIAFMAPEFQRR